MPPEPQNVCSTSPWEIATAIGTLLAIVVALFGRAIIKPRLNCSLFKAEGHRAQNAQGTPAWFWYVSVTNGIALGQATEPRVNITKIDKFGVNWDVMWDLPYPLSPAHNGLANPQALEPNSKATALFDAFSIWNSADRSTVHMHPWSIPFGFPFPSTGAQKFRVTFVAVCNETTSRPLSIIVDWDGQWAEPWQLMNTHIAIE